MAFDADHLKLASDVPNAIVLIFSLLLHVEKINCRFLLLFMSYIDLNLKKKHGRSKAAVRIN